MKKNIDINIKKGSKINLIDKPNLLRLINYYIFIVVLKIRIWSSFITSISFYGLNIVSGLSNKF